ncbi:MAG: rod shape-determining protein MreC [Brachymonas sp.]|nr:rod shape-determining protein MreC [Brachymonas sp.]
MSLHTFERKPPPMFRRGLSPLARFVLLATVSVFLMATDSRFQMGNTMRSAIATLLSPLQWLSAQPSKAVDLMDSYVTTVESAQQTQEQATMQMAQLALKAQRADLLARENASLRELLRIQQALPLEARAAEVAHVADDPFARKIVINKGSAEGVRLGAPVIDEHGLLGQVVRVFPLSSEVSLLDNPQQAVPVLNNRTGARSLVHGDSQNPRGNALEMRFLEQTADVQAGDQIVSSGVGGVYPAGLPVGTISLVEKRNTSAFLRVQLTPAARFLSVGHVLVLDPVELTPTEATDHLAAGRKAAQRGGGAASSSPSAASATASQPGAQP